jgi:hypothetical protein
LGFSEFATPSTTVSACFIQCSAALVKTASKRRFSPTFSTRSEMKFSSRLEGEKVS